MLIENRADREQDAIESDLKALKVSDWKTLVRKRSYWRWGKIPEESKTK